MNLSARPLGRKLFYITSFVIIFLVSAATVYFTLTFLKVFVKKSESKTTTSQQSSNIEPKDSYNILLLGYGGGGHSGGYLTDVLMVIHVEPLKNSAAMISIPRDTWVEIPVRSDLRQKHKINFAYAIGMDDTGFPLKEPQYQGEAGAGLLAKQAVEEVIGMPIDYFAVISFKGFSEAIDAIGGIDVDVPVAFDDYFYPVEGLENETCGKSGSEIASLSATLSGFDLEKQFICRYEHLHFDAGSQHIDGATALKFVRTRHSSQDGSDFARSRRQMAVLVGVENKLISLKALKNVDDFFSKFSSIVRTDIGVGELKDLAQIIGDPTSYKIKKIILNEDNVFNATRSSDGQFILIPKKSDSDFSGVQEYIAEQMLSK